MNRLSEDQRFTLAFAYQADFVPNPCTVTLRDEKVTLAEIAQRIYAVAQHGVIYEGRYIAGSEADRDRHKQ